MAAVVKRWRIKNASVDQLGPDSFRVVETIVVYGLEPSADDKALYDALNAAGVPDYGDAHVHYAGAKVRRRRVVTYSGTDAEIELTYETGSVSPQFPANGAFVIRDGASMEMAETQLDRSGNKIEVKYEKLVNGDVKWREKVVGTAKVMIPRRALSAHALRAERPSAAMLECVGKVNSVAWQGEGPRKWLCFTVEAETSDGGESYKIRVVWLHNRKTWDAFLVWKNEQGNIPGDVEVIDPSADMEGDQLVKRGMTRAKVYDEADFEAIFGI